jgi:hypothetical protein
MKNSNDVTPAKKLGLNETMNLTDCTKAPIRKQRSTFLLLGTASLAGFLFATAIAPSQSMAEGLPFNISVDGTPLFGGAKSTTKMRKKSQVLEAVDIQVKFDGLDVKPALNVSTAPIRAAYHAGERITFLASLNYPAWIEKSEIRIFTRDREGSALPFEIIPVGKDFIANWAMPASGPKDFIYVLRVYDSEGRFDETESRSLVRTAVEFPQHEPKNASVAPGYGEDFTARRNISVSGGAVTIYGRNIPEANNVIVLGEQIPVDPEGVFAVQRILPPGDHEVTVAVNNQAGEGLAFNRKINIPQNDWFYVALADLTLGRKFGSDHVEDVKPGEFENFYSKGHLSFYLKGKIRGRYLLTASADTGEDKIKNLFKGFDSKDPRQLLKRLDPNAFYPVYGDGSKLTDDAPTSGKFYIRLDRGDSHVMWGNFKTRITGSQFLRNERALYGASAVYRSETATPSGERSTEVAAYAARPGTLPQRDVLRGTGGSAYFLKHQDMTIGSETITIEIRDSVTGHVLERRILRAGTDYEVDYIQGLILLSKPLSSSTGNTGAVSSSGLGSNEVFLIAAYEYTPAATNVGGYIYGGRAQQWLGDHVRLGVTGMNEKTGSADQVLAGADVTLQKSDQTYIEGEIAQSHGPGFGNSVSADGGLTIDDIDTAGVRSKSANAYRIKMRADVGELTRDALKGDLEAYYEKHQKGFSSLDQQVNANQQIWGAKGDLQLSSQIEVGASYAEKRIDGGQSERELDAHITLHPNESWSFTPGIRHEKLTDPTPTMANTGARTDVGAKIAYQVDEDHGAYVFGQMTVDRTGKRDRNDRIGIGGNTRLSEKVDLSGEASYGSSGIGAQATLGYSSTADDHDYIGYRLSPDRGNNYGPSNLLSGNDLGAIVAGARHRYSEQLSMFAEDRYDMFGQRRTLAQTYGLDYTPSAKWRFNGGLEIGTITDDSFDNLTGLKNSDFDRKALSLSAGYHGENGFSANIKGEIRLEDSSDGKRDRTTYLLGASSTFDMSQDWRLQTNLNAAISNANTSALDGDYVEGSMGYAYRPIDNDRLNALFKYTFLYDLPGPDQVTIYGTTNGPRQKSQILSADVNYDINNYLSIGAKYGVRIGKSALRTGGGWEKASAQLGIIRADLRVVKNWDALLEGRVLHVDVPDSTEWGALAAIYRHINDNLKVGVGYNFGSFTDDLRDQTYGHQGVFINAIGQF